MTIHDAADDDLDPDERFPQPDMSVFWKNLADVVPAWRPEPMLPERILTVPAFTPPKPLDVEITPAPTKKQADQQLAHLAETKVLLATLTQTIQNAEEDRKQAELDRAEQKIFNRRMTIVAVALSFAAVVAPFVIYFLEHGWWWQPYRP